MKLFGKISAAVFATAFVTVSCTSDLAEDNATENSQSFKKNDLSLNLPTSLGKSSSSLSIFQTMNESMENYKLAQVEVYTIGNAPDAANTVTVLPIPDGSSTDYRTGFRFIPNDPRREGRDNLSYLTVSEFATSANGIASEEIFDQMYAIWANETNCNTVSIDKRAFNLATEGLPSSILSFGGAPLGPLADSNIIGYIPAFLFEALGLGEGTLAVNFSFGFRDENGNFTDVNNDGKIDLSHTETWFNDSFTWSTDDTPGTFDVNSVALHEFGHSLGHGHSGTLLATFDDNGQFTGELQYAPRNVMNALYIGPKTDLSGDDNSIYCENFSAWPWY